MAQNNPLPSDTRNKLHDGGTSKVPPNPPEPQEARGGVALKLSHEDAERYASQIRPSWDFVDEDVAANVAADLGLPIEVKPPAENKPAEAKADAKPSATKPPAEAKADAKPSATKPPAEAKADAKPSATKPPADEAKEKAPAPNEAGATKTSDTIIEGVPTLAIGGDPEPVVPAAAVSGEIPVDVDEPPIAASPVVAVGGAVNVEAAAIAAETKAETAPQEPPRKPQVRSKTRIGLGDGEDQPEKPSTKSAPASAPAAPAAPVASSRRAVNVAPAAAGPSRSEASAPARANPTPAPAGDEDIEIPGVNRSSNNTMMIVAALVAVIGLSLGAWALLRGGDKKAETPEPKPTVAATTATSPPPPVETAKATPPPADTPAVTAPPAATTPPPPVTAEPKATAKPADKPVDKPAPKPVAEKPAPAPSPKPEVKKPSGGKPTGGIIRETPF